MRSPGDAAAPAGNRGGATTDLLAGDPLQDTDLDAVTAAERAYAGALVLAVDDLARDALRIAPPCTVADPFGRAVAIAAERMIDAGIPRDEILVADYIERHRLLAAGWRASRLWSSLHELAVDCPIPANVRWYASVVVYYATRRRAVDAANRVVAVARCADDAELERILTGLSYAGVTA